MNNIVKDVLGYNSINGEVSNNISEYIGNGNLKVLTNNNDYIDIDVDILNSAYYKVKIKYSNPQGFSMHRFLINNNCYGSIEFDKTDNFIVKDLPPIKFYRGNNKITIQKQYGYLNVASIIIKKADNYISQSPEFILSNNKSTKECRNLIKYLSEIYGKKILSGQHCNKASMSDIEYIRRITGKTPAIVEFDMLSYSSSTETPSSSFECIDELENNKGSVDSAIKLAILSNVIISLCWHWFSPMNGRDKSFYTKNTDFDLERALIEGTDENKYLIMDLDLIAEQLKRFKDNNVSILWRPLHEACGGWFWWGASGAELYIKLYRLMYDRYVNYHKLNNLIWVWNSPNKEWYPGDDVVDISSIDYYAPIDDHGPLTLEFIRINSITDGKKAIALGENGPVPNPVDLINSETPWLWFMTWNNVSEVLIWNSQEKLKSFYNNKYVITLDDLPKLK